MNPSHSRWLVIAGLALVVIGVVDPLEGSVVILGGSTLVAAGALVSRTRYRLPVTALALIAVGVGAMFGMSALGGVGGNTGRSIGWLLLCLTYPIGWVLSSAQRASSASRDTGACEPSSDRPGRTAVALDADTGIAPRVFFTSRELLCLACLFRTSSPS
jgi:hypothetical protein